MASSEEVRASKKVDIEEDLITHQNIVQGKILDEERALYAAHDIQIVKCKFSGPTDGESCLKESHDLKIIDCDFELRYPMWHTRNAYINDCRMTTTCRAALWYNDNIMIKNCIMGGIKAVREGNNITISNTKIISPEFGWFNRDLYLYDCELEAEYAFLECKNLTISGLKMKGKYSFQYIENATIKYSYLDTKDAFWHTKGITVYDSIIKGEYLAWYSENLKLVHCKIIGTQPLCYAKGLVLEDCEMIDTDLSFEYSEVNASIIGNVISIKNPEHGRIECDSVGEIIIDENQHPNSDCQIVSRIKE